MKQSLDCPHSARALALTFRLAGSFIAGQRARAGKLSCMNKVQYLSAIDITLIWCRLDRRGGVGDPRRAMPEQATRRRFDREGYVVLPGFASAEAIAALRERAGEILAAFDPAEAGAPFRTRDQAASVDRWFLDSGDRVRCFLEAEAVDAAGVLRQPKQRAVNKIGHALHDRDPVFGAFSRDPRLALLADCLGLRQPLLWQSMYIFKQPDIGGEVRWHQDASFFVTTPITVTTFWLALEDADRGNGCLWVEPGGHHGPLREVFRREGDATRLERLDDTPWPDEARAVPLEVAAGTLVAFHGKLPHYSAVNRSPRSRHAYTLHVTDGRAAYAPENWLQRRADDPPRGF